jgi:glucosamine-6-phosphate deaminase
VLTTIYSSAEDAAGEAALAVAGALMRKPDLVLGLPAGRTMVPLYARMRSLVRAAPAAWRDVRVFQVDEFLGLGRGDAGSFRTFLEQHLLDDLRLPEERINFLDGKALDPLEECDRYDIAVIRAGGIDVQLLGIGTNGHIGFNEPGESLTARTHVATLREETRQANVGWFEDDLSRVPHQALSMGMATLLQARSVFLLATGEAKAMAVAQAADGPVTTQLPASFLQLHRDVHVFVDKAAAYGPKDAVSRPWRSRPPRPTSDD